ncbi:MAG: PHP domain-containing protein [Candidatus Odinarchaeia archaeon]
MKKWEKYKKYLLTGEWHIHTNYTDGENTIFEICEYAKKLKIPLIAFTEHIRKKPTYNFEEYVQKIDEARIKYPELIILNGVEAKVLPGGKLDVKSEILSKVDLCMFAFHSFPINLEEYYSSLKTIIKNPNVDIWGHPGLFLKKNNLTLRTAQLEEIFELMSKNKVLLELNNKYSLPKTEWLKKALEKGVIVVRGGDIHKLSDFNRKKYKKSI